MIFVVLAKKKKNAALDDEIDKNSSLKLILFHN